MLKVCYTPHFVKQFKKIPPSVQAKAIKKEFLFKRDPRSPSLKTHALTHKLKGYYAFSVTYHYRILFAFEPNVSVTFIDIGTHSIYK